MSFILDAIKKSDKERQKNKQNNSVQLQSARSPSFAKKSKISRALKLLAALLLIAVFLWLLRPFIQLPVIVIPQLKTQSDARSVEQPDVPVNEIQPDVKTVLTQSKPITSTTQLPPRNEIKELWEMPADFQQRVPDLEIAFHIYSNVPDESVVHINGRRVRTGRQVLNGMTLHLITETGVIVSFENRFFHVETGMTM